MTSDKILSEVLYRVVLLPDFPLVTNSFNISTSEGEADEIIDIKVCVTEEM